MKDVRDAYTAFGFDINDSQLDEDHIIGTFQSRVSDAPKQEADLRVALKTIGQHRNSHSIEQFAANRKSLFIPLHAFPRQISTPKPKTP